MFDPDALARDLIARKLAKLPLPNKVWIQLSDDEMAMVKAVAASLRQSQAYTRRILLLRGLQMDAEK